MSSNDAAMDDLRRRYEALQRIADEFPAMEQSHEQLDAAIEQITDPEERKRAQLDAARSKGEHLTIKSLNQLGQHLLQLHAAVIEIEERLRAVEQRL